MQKFSPIKVKLVYMQNSSSSTEEPSGFYRCKIIFFINNKLQNLVNKHKQVEFHSLQICLKFYAYLSKLF